MYFQLDRIRTKNITYGSHSVKSKTIDVWNSLNKSLPHEKLPEKSRKYCKKILTNFLFEKY